MCESNLIFYHVGLPLDEPSLPFSDAKRKEILKSLQELSKDMESHEAVKQYKLVWVTELQPESINDLRTLLKEHPPHGVIVGGGVMADPKHWHLLEQIVDITHNTALNAKVIFIQNPSTVKDSVRRWFKFE